MLHPSLGSQGDILLGKKLKYITIPHYRIQEVDLDEAQSCSFDCRGKDRTCAISAPAAHAFIKFFTALGTTELARLQTKTTSCDPEGGWLVYVRSDLFGRWRKGCRGVTKTLPLIQSLLRPSNLELTTYCELQGGLYE